MGKIIKHSVFFLVVIIIIAALYFFSFPNAPQNQLNIVEVNRLNETIKERNGDFSSLDDYESYYDFFILDLYGNKIYAKNEFPDETRINTFQNGYISIPITIKNEETAYILYINTNTQEMIDASFKSQKINLYLFLAAEIIVVISYFFYLYSYVIKPLKKVEEASFRIASGDNSFPVLADKNNVFGAFTQSFNLMRISLADAKENEMITIQDRKDFVSTIGHDLKLPLTSISTIAQLLNVKYQDNPDLSEKLQTIEDKTFQIKTLLDTMIQSEHEEVTQLSVEITELESNVLYSLIKNSTSKVNINMAAIPVCTFAADIDRLEQIINNVVGNSEKYAGTDINVTFSAEQRYLIIRIEDFGKGVTEDELYKIWEKGFRGRDALGFELPGEGLGLYNVKSILLKMRGFPWAENTKTGFAVSIYLNRIS